MIQEGDFLKTAFGPGLVINKYKRTKPDKYMGEKPIVYDLLTKDKIMIGIEPIADQKLDERGITLEDKRNIISGLFEKIRANDLRFLGKG
jgi:hypothetical protein